MQKAVLRGSEVTLSDKKVFLEAPTNFHGFVPLGSTVPNLESTEEELSETESYEGPTADDLRREAEAFREDWEKQREAMINAAKAEAEAIVKQAEEAAFQDVKRKTDQAQKEKRSAQDEAEDIIAKAKLEAAAIEAKAKTALSDVQEDARKQGFSEGREQGFSEGKAEAERLINRLHQILEKAQDKRVEILAEAEQQIVDLVLLISRKVIKILSESQRNVVVSNVVQALRKVKGRGDVAIRVNLDDLKLTTEHTKDFLRLIEGVKNITVLEDSSVDRGGCIIETEFGEVDARIASQLSELETKILEISPIKAKGRTVPIDER